MRHATREQLSDTEVSRQAARKSRQLLDQFEMDTQLELHERSHAPPAAFPPSAPQRRDIAPVSPPHALFSAHATPAGALHSYAPRAASSFVNGLCSHVRCSRHQSDEGSRLGSRASAGIFGKDGWAV